MSISVQGISKSFKGRRKGESDNQVLKDVSFEIEEGQFVCLLGPSGCGKTTTMKTVMGVLGKDLIHVPDGKIDFAGKMFWK